MNEGCRLLQSCWMIRRLGGGMRRFSSGLTKNKWDSKQAGEERDGAGSKCMRRRHRGSRRMEDPRGDVVFVLDTLRQKRFHLKGNDSCGDCYRERRRRRKKNLRVRSAAHPAVLYCSFFLFVMAVHSTPFKCSTNNCLIYVKMWLNFLLKGPKKQ